MAVLSYSDYHTEIVFQQKIGGGFNTVKNHSEIHGFSFGTAFWGSEYLK